ncbi:MAG TPA: type II and III secretion system protein [Elusimicrobiota bacterium]|nr:type II and III secretion system protein [Elusimicrobiota bacterium]
MTASAEAKPLIQIGIEVVEVDEQKSQQLGLEWFNQMHLEEVSAPAVFAVGAFTRSQMFADLQVLMNEGAADLLANPKLVTRDATTATFHAGGELPYATAGTLGTVTIEFKPYGVNLKINPHIDDAGKIVMSLDAEVSGPDTQNSVTLAGNTVPAIRSRNVTSQLTMDPGSTLTMAGLIQSDKEWTREGVPGLMHIPLLGYLFSHKTEIRKKTSIVVFVTPAVLSNASVAAAGDGTPSSLPPQAIEPYPTEDAPLPTSFEPAPGKFEGLHG